MDDELLYTLLSQRPPAKQRIGFVGWCVRAFEWAMLFILGLFVWFYILPLVGAALTGEQPTAPPAQASDKKPAEAPFKTTNGGGGGGSHTTNGGGSSTLPPCSQVTDTTTACQQDAPAAQAQEEPTPIPPTATPAYMTECITPPGERPCWLPPEAEWKPVEAVPETPIVLLPEPTSPPLVFSDSACAAWRPPLVMPERCEDE